MSAADSSCTYESTAWILGVPAFNEWARRCMRWVGAAHVLAWQLVNMWGERWVGMEGIQEKRTFRGMKKKEKKHGNRLNMNMV